MVEHLKLYNKTAQHTTININRNVPLRIKNTALSK